MLTYAPHRVNLCGAKFCVENEVQRDTMFLLKLFCLRAVVS